MTDPLSVATSAAREYAFTQCGWLPQGLNPKRLLSLLQMFEINAAKYVNIGVAIQAISDNINVNLAPEEEMSAAAWSTVFGAFKTIIECSQQLNLAVCAGMAHRLMNEYSKATPTYGQARNDIRALKLALDVELAIRKFFFVPPGRSEYYTDDILIVLREFSGKMQPFQRVLEAFPSTQDDLVEAGNCLAFDRPTACVFHLMRVMEVGLKAIAKALSVGYTSNWGQCIAEIEKAGQKADPFSIEAIAYLRSAKNAWRNPTMHVERTYSEQEAERIMNAVQAFMVHLAGRLTE